MTSVPYPGGDKTRNCFSRALFDCLERGCAYRFEFSHGGFIRSGVFHEYRPDGTVVIGSNGRTHIVNPAHIVWASRIEA